MGRTRRVLGLATLVALGVPPLAAAIVRSRFEASAEDDDDLRIAAIFENRQARSTADALQRGEAIAWYAGLDLDLREATLADDGAWMRVVALYGGARLVVPSDWDVRVRPIAVFGGVDARTEPPAGPAPRLIVDAIAVFGAIQVTDRPDEDDVLLESPFTEAAFARAEAEAELEAAGAAGEPVEEGTPGT